MIVDCEARIWDLRGVDFADPEVASFWDSMMEHGRILTREKETLQELVTPDDLVAMMDRRGIDHALLTSFAFASVMPEGFDPAQLVLDAMREHPTRMTSYLSVNPQLPSATRDLASWVEQGVRCVSIYPPEGFYPDDRSVCYPFYERCLEAGIDTVFVHCGLQSQPQLELKYAHPLHLDAAARDFPALRFVVEHFAYPWEADLIAVAWKHKNVYICCTYLAAELPWAPGPMWHAVGRAIRDLGTHEQLVWGSDWAFWTERNVEQQIDSLKSFQIPERLREEWGYPEITEEMRTGLLGDNAARLFQLEARAAA